MRIKKADYLSLFQALFAASAMVLLTIPAFGMTGEIVKPLLLCFFGSIAICTGILFSQKSEKVAGLSLLFLMIFWLLYTFIKEMILQYQVGFVFRWIEFFYFDKLLILGSVWLTSALFFCLRRLIIKTEVKDYSLFFRYSGAAFIIFYSFLLIYSFVLIRLQKGDFPFRFQPFVTINEYISDYSEIPYEVFMMFFGNLFYFTPLGYIFSVVLRRRSILFKSILFVLYPIIAFTILEFSQFWLQNGYCEFDDMMMNSIGFWLGNLLYFVSNKLSYLLSKGRYKSFWD